MKMNRRLKIAAPALVLFAALAACAPTTPETTFSWGVNDRLSRPAPATRTARTYTYQAPQQDKNSVSPAPRPRPAAPARPDRVARAPASHMDFLWPATGQIIGRFGASPSGERNDGINIALPLGTPIKAAASGTVSYSGNELKEYGNLLLINHEGGYVTAYAHAQQLLVQRGDKVTKGQIIGYAGQTGGVTTPQLHFEIRHDTTPLNPTTLLASRSS